LFLFGFFLSLTERRIDSRPGHPSRSNQRGWGPTTTTTTATTVINRDSSSLLGKSLGNQKRKGKFPHSKNETPRVRLGYNKRDSVAARFSD
jgi:hypothetical protein